MAERASFPPPPEKSKLVTADFLITLQWLAWLGGLVAWIGRFRVHAFSVDIPNIPVGNRWWADFNTTGAVPGDFAKASIDPAHRDLSVTAQVVSAGVTTVWVSNFGAADVDLAPGILRVNIERAR